ncbi:helix-turn-helix transcriptional regulator [Paenarthrobacter nitroguajacolicus]|uniref:helix-turn-helix transcriptional regulator n=1 Tax=Paenarthrobacter nitroguajacolicus TaxID=211146 RepID=UPI0015BBC7F5|nr:helix-turn-helix transcriptional regulator [Paenarthrobacter nitroguajacolicus]NWL31709.1 transcriptional regulator [Paenarthrobacter nitroguajacolicus]
MDNRTETRDFLSTRRAKITPEQTGLAAYGGNRRVPGLRRGEVAILAGVSVEYYTRLERGNLAGVSESVLESLANALQLDDAERAHLYDLARAASEGGRSRRRPVRKQVIRPGVQLTLDAISGSPAFIRNGRLDLLATNALGRALYSDIYDSPAGPPNHARFLFLDPRSRDFYTDWERAANDTVAIMRTEAGRDPYDRGLSDLVGELSTRSEEFRVRWASHNVRQHYTGKKHFRHRIVGDLHLLYEALELSADAGLTLTVYNAEPGTGTADALQLLASWAATTPAIPEDAGDLRNIHNK